MREPDAPSSRHAAIASALRAEIRSGALAPGSALPSEAELSTRFSVSRGTVRQALGALRAEGLITGGRGRPPSVSRPVLAQSFYEMISFSTWAEQLGRAPGARTLELTRRPADSVVARELDLEPGVNVVQYRRLRLLDGVPALIELSSFTEPAGRLLFDCDLDHASVYGQLAERGVAFAEAEQSLAAIAAGPEQATLLGVPRRAPLLEVRRRVFDRAGAPIEWSIDTYRGDAFAVTIHNGVALPRAGVGLTLIGG
jgi:GntR family transcriptional regulator